MRLLSVILLLEGDSLFLLNNQILNLLLNSLVGHLGTLASETVRQRGDQVESDTKTGEEGEGVGEDDDAQEDTDALNCILREQHLRGSNFFLQINTAEGKTSSGKARTGEQDP